MIKGLNVKGLDTCYSAVYTSQTHKQQLFAISKVTADWRNLNGIISVAEVGNNCDGVVLWTTVTISYHLYFEHP